MVHHLHLGDVVGDLMPRVVHDLVEFLKGVDLDVFRGVRQLSKDASCRGVSIEVTEHCCIFG